MVVHRTRNRSGGTCFEVFIQQRILLWVLWFRGRGLSLNPIIRVEGLSPDKPGTLNPGLSKLPTSLKPPPNPFLAGWRPRFSTTRDAQPAQSQTTQLELHNCCDGPPPYLCERYAPQLQSIGVMLLFTPRCTPPGIGKRTGAGSAGSVEAGKVWAWGRRLRERTT